MPFLFDYAHDLTSVVHLEQAIGTAGVRAPFDDGASSIAFSFYVTGFSITDKRHGSLAVSDDLNFIARHVTTVDRGVLLSRHHEEEIGAS